MHKLVILGSLDEFVQLIEMAKARGIYTIVCDGYKGSIGKQHADKAYDIDVGDTDAIVRMCQEEEADGIITSFSDYLFECMVKIAAGAGLKCYFGPEHLPYYRDKTKMKDMLTGLGIGTPAHVCVEKGFADEELSGITFPAVVKPVDKYGSRGVQILYSAEEVRRQFDYTCETSDVKRILVEEYHDGYEFNMMTWVLDGQVQVISIADREKSAVGRHEIPISSRNVYPSRLLDSVHDEAKAILQKTAEFTGQQEGPLSMQFFWRPEEQIQVCEVAGRFFGYEHELTELAGGLCIEKLLLDYVYDEPAVRETFRVYSPAFPRMAAVLYFHGRPGMRIADQSKAFEIAKIPGVKMAQIFYREGEKIVQHGPNPYAARFYITGETRGEADSLTGRIFEEMSVCDENGEQVLYTNLLPSYSADPHPKN